MNQTTITNKRLPPFSRVAVVYSKLLAAVMFVAFPFFGFVLGVKYQEGAPPEITTLMVIKRVKAFGVEINDMRDRCGVFPETILIDLHLSKAGWSPDCRYVGWGTGEVASETRSLYLYSDRTGKIEKITGRNAEGEPVFMGWKDSRNMVFRRSLSDSVYEYDVADRETRLIR